MNRTAWIEGDDHPQWIWDRLFRVYNSYGGWKYSLELQTRMNRLFQEVNAISRTDRGCPESKIIRDDIDLTRKYIEEEFRYMGYE